jgi:hypothetical protein
MQFRWDFADDGLSGKWSAYQNVYRHLYRTPTNPGATTAGYDTGHSLVITKNKIRGRGRSLKLRFKAEADKDMVIVGWATTLNGTGAE